MAKKIKLAFANDRKIDPFEKAICEMIINHIRKSPNITGSTLSLYMKLTPQTVRTYIKTIREYNSLFLGSEYLIAHKSGYVITSNKKELKAYHHKLQAMTHSKVKQLNELNEALND